MAPTTIEASFIAMLSSCVTRTCSVSLKPREVLIIFACSFDLGGKRRT